jgi:hypothetical protein
LLNLPDQEPKLDNHIEIRKLTALGEAEEPVYKRKERTMAVSKLTDGLALVEAGIRIYEDTDSKEQQAAITTKALTRTSAYYEEILTENKSVSCQISVLDFFKSSSGTPESPPVLFDIVGDDPVGPPPVQEEVPLLLKL